jgi:hypothetical protein
MESAFAQPIQAVLGYFQADPKTGLTDEQVVTSRVKYGKNGMSNLGRGSTLRPTKASRLLGCAIRANPLVYQPYPKNHQHPSGN